MIVALIPAAGRSERMGRPKLTLPIEGIPLIARVISSLREGGVDRVIVIAPPQDTQDVGSLVEVARKERAEVVSVASPTSDMRASVETGLAFLATRSKPTAVLLTPGDIPRLNAVVVAMVIQRATERPDRIVVPTYQGRRGHPVLIPWILAGRISHLPAGVGVNALLIDNSELVETVDTDDSGILADLDTPEDYERIIRS